MLATHGFEADINLVASYADYLKYAPLYDLDRLNYEVWSVAWLPEVKSPLVPHQRSIVGLPNPVGGCARNGRKCNRDTLETPDL